MAAITFSLTKDIIIDPIITATLQPLPNPNDDDAMMEHCCNTEVLTRVGSLFISAFAVADAFVHLLSALYKTAGFALAHFGCLNLADWDGDEIAQHFVKTAFFAALAIAGPVIGFIYPGAFLDYWGPPAGYIPPPPPLFPPVNPNDFAEPAKEPNPISRPQFFQLVEDVKAGNGKAAWPQLQTWFNCGSVEERVLFFEVFGSDEVPQFQEIRQMFSKTYYKPVPGADQAHLSGWLSSAELAKRLDPNDPLVLNAQQEVLAIAGEAPAALPEEEFDPAFSDELLAQLVADGCQVPRQRTKEEFALSKEMLAQLQQEGFQVADALKPQQPQNPSNLTAEERIANIFTKAVRLNEGLYFHGTKGRTLCKVDS